MTDQMARPKRGRPGHDQASVLATAVDLFTQRGFDGTSIGDIADALGVTKSAVYHHVSSKDDLLAQALDQALSELEASVQSATVASGSSFDRLHSVVQRSVEVLVAHQPAVTLLLRVHGNSETERQALRRRRAIDARLAAMVRDAIDEGSLRKDLDPDLVSRLIFGMVNSLVEWYRSSGTVSVDELAGAVAAIAFNGIASAKPD